MSSPSRNVSSSRYRDVTLLYFWLMENHFTVHHKSSYCPHACTVHDSIKYFCQTDTFLPLSSLLPDKNKSCTCCYRFKFGHDICLVRKGTVPKLTSVHNQIWTKRCKEIKEWVSGCSSHKQLSTTSTQTMNWVDNTGVDETEADKQEYHLIFQLWWEAM